jgi:hypothetical protein
MHAFWEPCRGSEQAAISSLDSGAVGRGSNTGRDMSVTGYFIGGWRGSTPYYLEKFGSFYSKAKLTLPKHWL